MRSDINTRAIQEWLVLNGFKVVVDGDLGPATEFAIKQFQLKIGLPCTGAVDDRTLQALSAPLRRAQAKITSGGPFGDLMVVYARQHLDEHPREVGGENCGPWVRFYGEEGQPWCAGFISTILKQAAATLNFPLPLRPSLSCDELAQDAKKRGILTTSPVGLAPGALFLNRKSPTDWVHTGIVIAFHDDCMTTIEGNTNDDGAREGYEVCQRIRGYKDKDFIKL
jgi:peptidoglycan hydrolase-like protein with peptidoglycan-binding domain